jgi:23S rRNA (cytidine1920-2'-O)/16S rRNA (cytidine1409-2'-O)-methyltransferase
MGKYVSRAGEKLEFAIKHFNTNTFDTICADFGCSTGGFTDCLLQSGAKKVYSIDTAYGELDWKIRNNENVIVMERTNAMYVDLPEKMDLITIDVSWTKQEKILPSAFKNLKTDGNIISLIKPHYEAPKSYLRKGKLPDEYMEQVLGMVKDNIKNVGGTVNQMVESPILGEKGKNKEYLALIKPPVKLR